MKFLKAIIDWIKTLFCKHDYGIIGDAFVYDADGNLIPNYFMVWCDKCGKIKDMKIEHSETY